MGCRTDGCFIAPLTRAWWVSCWAINYSCLGLCKEENPQVTGTSFGSTLDQIHVPSNPSDRTCLQQMQRLCCVLWLDGQGLKCAPVVPMVNPGLLQECDYIAWLQSCFQVQSSTWLSTLSKCLGIHLRVAWMFVLATYSFTVKWGCLFKRFGFCVFPCSSGMILSWLLACISAPWFSLQTALVIVVPVWAWYLYQKGLTSKNFWSKNHQHSAVVFSPFCDADLIIITESS